MYIQLCTNTDQCSLTEDTEKQDTLWTIDTTCDKYDVDPSKNIAPKLTNLQRLQNPLPMPKQQAGLSNPPPKLSDSSKEPSKDPSKLELQPELIIDIDNLLKELNSGLIINILEKAVEYIAVATTQLKSLSPMNTEELCYALKAYLSKLPRDA